MQRTSFQGGVGGGAAVQTVPAFIQRGREAIMEEVIKLAEMEGFDLDFDDLGKWHWIAPARKRELLRQLPQTNEQPFESKADAAFDAISVLGAVLDAHFPRHCAPAGARAQAAPRRWV